MTDTAAVPPAPSGILYEPIPLGRTLRGFREGRHRGLLWVWVGALLASVALGLASIVFAWSGLPVTIGGITGYVTIYPPLVLSTLLTLWLGFWWGFIPAYLATLVLALYSGMSSAESALFALADPIGLAVLAIAYRAVPMTIAPRWGAPLLFYVFVTFVGGVAGSSGSFIWTYANDVGTRDVLGVWQGWWLGATLQGVLIDGPILWFCSGRVARWKTDLEPPEWSVPRARHALAAIGTVTGVLVLFVGLSAYLTLQNVRTLIADQVGAGVAGLDDALEGLTVGYGVVVVLLVFLSFLGYQLAIGWNRSLRRSVRKQTAEILQLNVSLEERVVQRTEELEAALGELKMFSYSISHDLQGPIEAIDGYAGMVAESHPAPSEEQRRLLGMIRRNAVRTGELLHHLLELFVAGHRDLVYAEIDTRQMAREAFASARQNRPSDEVQFICDDLPAIHADPILMRQVFANLLSNAVKFTGNRDVAQIHVQGRRDSTRFVCAIRDNGVGFATDGRELFDVFARGASAKGFSGSGIGLAIVRRIVERHGGAVWAEGVEGEGATFYFSVPAEPTG